MEELAIMYNKSERSLFDVERYKLDDILEELNNY
jgi:hypothetical protein